MNLNYSILFIIFFFVACKKDVVAPVTQPPTPVPTAPKLPETITFEVSDLSLYSVTFNGKIVDTGDSKIIEFGFVVDTVPTPTISRNLNKMKVANAIDGAFRQIVTDVPPEKTYYIRTYATNAQG